MLLVVFRESLGPELQTVFEELPVKAYTETAKVFGVGETGKVKWPGMNSMVLACMEEDQAERLIMKLKEFCDTLSGRQQGAKIPLHVFVLPCEQVM